jgi:putative polyhydroxyalkanoate system protein
VSRIDVHKRHDLGIPEARVRLKVIEKDLHDRFRAALEWHGDWARVCGRGVEGTVVVADARVEVTLRVGFLFSPLTSRIRKEIVEALDRAFP